MSQVRCSAIPGFCRALLVVAFLSLAACSPGKVAPQKRYFWPPGDIQPRIEFINFYQVEQDVRRDMRWWLEEYVLGKEQPEFMFRQPQGIVSDCRGKVYASDISRNRVFVYDFNKHVVTTLKDGVGKDYGEKVWSLDIDDQGQVFGTLNLRGEIVRFGADGRVKGLFGEGELVNPAGIAFDPVGRRLFVTDTRRHQLLVYSTEGQLQATFGRRGNQAGEFNFPTDVDVDKDGTVFVLDSMNARVQVFDSQLRFLRSFGERGTASGSFMVAKGLAVSPAGHVYVTDALAHRVVIFDREGKYLLTFGGKNFVSNKVAPGGFYMPAGIDVDCNNTIWIADSLNRMFHQFQYLDESYLAKHPILPGQAVLPQTGGKLDVEK